MDRKMIYPGQIPLETDILDTNRFALIGLGKLAAAVLGTTTLVNGLACTPTSPASMQVQVAPGEIYSLQNLDGTAYSSLAADTTHQILKQGLLMDAVTLSCPAPSTSGYSINYLIEATYQDVDANPTVLPYYNASNPSQAYSGPANSGTAQNTTRNGVCTVAVKAGVAAATGTQQTPAADSGYVGLWVVTVAYGQTSVTASNITPVAGAPIISNLLTMMQTASPITARDVGSVNAYAMNLQPAISAYTPGMIVSIQNIKATNTGASTLSINGLAALPIYGPAATAMQGGELAASYGAILRVNSTATAFELVATTGGSLPVKAATASNQAVNWAQAGTQILTPAASSTVTPVAFTTLVFTNFSAAGTITVNPGAFGGQRVLVYGCGYPVTTQTNVASGSPFLAFPDGSQSYTWVSNGYNQVIEMVWDGVNWRCTTAGQTIVSAATQSNAAVRLGQVATPSNLVYNNVTSSRAIGTTYTNSTGRPLLVQVEVYTAATAGAGTRLFVNGSEVSCFYTPVALSVYGMMTATVPPGQTYQVTNASGSNSISIWQEY
ncbi:MAG: hypothetical protein JHC40_01155 [Burkholderiales bacterium]|nr:hypothetical protein [Burkholderiales bacterium]